MLSKARLLIMSDRQPPQEFANRRTSWCRLRLRRGKVGVDPFRHIVRRVGHRANATPLRGMRSKTHLKRQVFGGSTEIVSLLLGKLVHDQVPCAVRPKAMQQRFQLSRFAR